MNISPQTLKLQQNNLKNATEPPVFLGYESIEDALYANVIDRLPAEVIATMNVGGDVAGLMNNLRVGGDMLLAK